MQNQVVRHIRVPLSCGLAIDRGVVVIDEVLALFHVQITVISQTYTLHSPRKRFETPDRNMALELYEELFELLLARVSTTLAGNSSANSVFAVVIACARSAGVN